MMPGRRKAGAFDREVARLTETLRARGADPLNLFEERHAARVVADQAYRADLLARMRRSPIVVANVRTTRDGVYVGRRVRSAGLHESPLANPFKIGASADGTRAEVIAKYEHWLAARLVQVPGRRDYTQQLGEVVRLAEFYIDRGALTLLCWCAPEACHADVLAKIITERARRIVENEGRLGSLHLAEHGERNALAPNKQPPDDDR